MRKLVISTVAAVVIVNSAIAQEIEKRVVYEESDRDYFAVDVQYSRQADGREHCSLALLDRQSENVLSLIVPGSKSEVAIIIFAVPNGLFGLGQPHEAQSLVFNFVDQSGEKTQNSALGYWNFNVEEVQSTSHTVSHVLFSRVDDLWGFARDWHDSAAVFVQNESGEDMGSMTLHRAEEGLEALAECWSGTED